MPDGWLKLSGEFGQYGVFAFFVISGFIIPYSLARAPFVLTRDAPLFLLRRIIRLEPAYLAAALMSAALIYLAEISPFGSSYSGRLAFDLALHPAYLVPWFNGHWVNPVFWTLAIEFQYYFAALLFAPLLLSASRAAQRGALASALALSFASSDHRVVFMYLPIFGIGFSYFVFKCRKIRVLEFIGWLIGFAAAGVAVLGLPQVVAGLLTVVLLSAPQGLIQSRTLLWFGTISYSLYLMHVPIGAPILNLASRLGRGYGVSCAAIACACIASIIAAYILWRLVELPSLRLAHSFSRKKNSLKENPAPAAA